MFLQVNVHIYNNSLYLQYISIIYFILTNSECSFVLFSNMYSNMFSNMYCVIRLTHFSPVSHFYTRWKRQKTKVFLTFSRGIEMWHWTKMAYGHSLLVWENVGFPNLVWLLLLACLFVFCEYGLSYIVLPCFYYLYYVEFPRIFLFFHSHLLFTGLQRKESSI